MIDRATSTLELEYSVYTVRGIMSTCVLLDTRDWRDTCVDTVKISQVCETSPMKGAPKYVFRPDSTFLEWKNILERSMWCLIWRGALIGAPKVTHFLKVLDQVLHGIR